MALACMLWRSSVRTTSPVSAALRTLMKNTPLWSTEPVWRGQSGPVAPSWHHPQAKKQTLQVSGKISALIWPRFASDWGVRAVHAYRQNHQKPRVHKILLWSFGTFASITFYDSEESDSACLEAMLRIFLSFCMLWLNWYIQALRCSDVWSWRGLDGVPLTRDQSATAEEAVGHPLWRFSENESELKAIWGKTQSIPLKWPVPSPGEP